MKKVRLNFTCKKDRPSFKKFHKFCLNQDYSDQHIQIILLLGIPVPGLNQLLKEKQNQHQILRY
jgi:hypothetical protein